MKKGLIVLILLLSAALLFARGAQEPEPTGEVEVLHWWTSGGEAASVAVLKSLLEEEGHAWKDFAVAGGGGDQAMTVLRSRAVAGNPPTAAQVKGPQIQDWAEEGFLTNLDDVAKAEKWDDLIPKVLADIMKYQGHWVAVPVNVHRINWMWVNPQVFEKAGADIPKTWAEFETAAKKIQAAGMIPVAWGGQPWQEATVFETIVAGLGGTDFYKKTMVEADPAAINSPTMVKCLETLKMMKQYTDPGAPGRDWNLATAMVIKGEAGMQFMGDWAKGEFTAAGKKPDVDYIATHAPGTSKQFLFNVDSFIMFDVKDSAAKAAQKAMARLIIEPKFQEVFNINKGSIPVRMGMPEDPFDIPARLSMKDFASSAKTGDLVPSMAHEMATKRAIRGAIMDTVTSFYNSDMTAAAAAAQMADAVRAAK
jgi:glucose/mannose transport system substrate-binding protein